MEQFFPALRRAGIEYDYSWLLDDEDLQVFYAPGRIAAKAALAARATLVRAFECAARRFDRYDVVFVQREASFIGGPFTERAIARSRARFVYDFDDAIWLQAPVSPGNARFALLKNVGKIPQIVAMADTVIAGNRYLAEWALRYNPRVHVVPSTIDAAVYRPKRHHEGDRPVCIGWTGSFSTLPHFALARPALLEIRRRLGARVRMLMIGLPAHRDPELGLETRAWSPETEALDVAEIDVGIMPLPDDAWSRGKCAMKAIQYMAAGIPPVVSPVGVNLEVVTDGVDGRIPRSEQEWIEALETLCLDHALRARMGAAARRTFEERYATGVWADRFIAILRGTAPAPTPAAQSAMQVRA
jgi:glycosyltransferase involved in cell wall biosynthesis